MGTAKWRVAGFPPIRPTPRQEDPDALHIISSVLATESKAARLLTSPPNPLTRSRLECSDTTGTLTPIGTRPHPHTKLSSIEPFRGTHAT